MIAFVDMEPSLKMGSLNEDNKNNVEEISASVGRICRIQYIEFRRDYLNVSFV